MLVCYLKSVNVIIIFKNKHDMSVQSVSKSNILFWVTMRFVLEPSASGPVHVVNEEAAFFDTILRTFWTQLYSPNLDSLDILPSCASACLSG